MTQQLFEFLAGEPNVVHALSLLAFVELSDRKTTDHVVELFEQALAMGPDDSRRHYRHAIILWPDSWAG